MSEEIFTIIIGLAALFIVLWIYILLPAGMATKRDHSAIGWVILSLLFSPILACLLKRNK